jgi:hypothetical protein
MTGYVRKDTTNNIADGNVINAADLDNEFDGIQDAFNASTGHNHDGTSGEGAPITALGPTQDVTVSATLLVPKTTNTVDIGSSALKFKDFFLAGNGSIGGTLAVTGVATLGNGAILGTPASGTVTNLTGTASININGTVGATTASAGAFTTLSATGAITSTLATGSAPLVIASTTKVANLNVDLLDGADWAAPAALGSTTPAAVSATTLAASGATSLTGSATIFNSATNTLSLQKSGGAASILFGSNTAANGQITSIASGGLFFSTGDITQTEKMRITAAGEVGIGTSSPAKRLDVRQAYTADTVVAQIGNTNNGNGSTPVATIFDFTEANGTPVTRISSIYTQSTGKTDLVFGTYNSGLAEKMRLDSAGNLGLGVTPSAWGTTGSQRALQFTNGFALSSSGSGAGDGSLTWNGYYNGTNWIYNYTGGASNRFRLNESGAAWFTAPSGTAGNAITFTQAMTLDASGVLLVGKTSNSAYAAGGALFAVNGAADNGVSIAQSQSTGPLLTFFNSANSGFGGISQSAAGTLTISSTTALTFNVNSAERARIDSSGNLLVGTTSQVNSCLVSLSPGAGKNGINIPVSSSCAGVLYNGTGAYNYNAHVFNYNTSTQVGYIQVQSTSTVYSTSSDYRLKNSIAPMTGALAKVALLKPCTYKWNADGSDGQGFIAHELAEVVPQCVTGEKDGVNEDGTPKYQGIDTSFLVATLTAAIQELKAEFDAYKASHP